MMGEENMEYFNGENEDSDRLHYLNNDVFEIEQANNEERKLPKHRRCLSHLLNLVEKDFVKKLSGSSNEAYVATFTKLQTIWVFPRKSSEAKAICDSILGCKLKFPCDTRWNSKFDCIRQISKLQSKINEYVETIKKSKKKGASHLQTLEEEDWIVINAYLKVLEPVAISLDRLQGEKDCGQGIIIPTLLSMKHRITILKGGKLLKSFQNTMLSVIDGRFSKYFKVDEASRDLVVASMSTPRFKSSFLQDDTNYIIARNMLISECLKENSTKSVDLLVGQDKSENVDDDFYITFTTRHCRRSSVEQSIELEISRYLDDERKDIAMLHEYPTIKNIYRKFNTTLSASGVVERVFSQTKLIFTPHRTRLLSVNFERLVLLKYNRSLLD